MQCQKLKTYLESGRVIFLPPKGIQPNPSQPRQVFDEDSLSELASSIRQHGILQPLTVRKTPQGWEDCDISFSLILTNDEDSSCYDKLQTLAGMFSAPDDKANPRVMAVTNRHLLARGVRQVVFSRFDSSETDRTDEITVSLGFSEHNPPIVRTEQAQAKSPTPGELAEAAAEKAAKEQPTQEDALFVDAAGYEQGGKA